MLAMVRPHSFFVSGPNRLAASFERGMSSSAESSSSSSELISCPVALQIVRRWTSPGRYLCLLVLSLSPEVFITAALRFFTIGPMISPGSSSLMTAPLYPWNSARSGLFVSEHSHGDSSFTSVSDSSSLSTLSLYPLRSDPIALLQCQAYKR